MPQQNLAGFVAAIGNTPLIRLKGISDMTGCDIYGKAEFMNPGGSVKDRAAKAIIEDAEARGTLTPGGLIVEGTAGNTGIGLTMVGNAKGYKSVIVMPETQSEEKKDVLKVCGADLRLVPPSTCMARMILVVYLCPCSRDTAGSPKCISNFAALEY